MRTVQIRSQLIVRYLKKKKQNSHVNHLQCRRVNGVQIKENIKKIVADLCNSILAECHWRIGSFLPSLTSSHGAASWNPIAVTLWTLWLKSQPPLTSLSLCYRVLRQTHTLPTPKCLNLILPSVLCVCMCVPAGCVDAVARRRIKQVSFHFCFISLNMGAVDSLHCESNPATAEPRSTQILNLKPRPWR